MEISRLKPRTARIGFFGVAFDAYWPQFETLEEKLTAYHRDLKEQIERNGVEVIDFGIVDNNEKAFETAEKMQGANLDILFCNMLTYATSCIFAPILRNVSLPMILLALQPRERMDYSNAHTQQQLENDNICAVPEFVNVSERFGKKINDVVIGMLYGDAKAAADVARWCEIAKVLHDLKGSRFGLMGHVLDSMYDMHADPTSLCAAFNIHIPLLEIDDMLTVQDTVTEAEIKEQSELILSCFDTPDPKTDPLTMKLTDRDLYAAARASKTLDRFIQENRLTGLAYYYAGRLGSEHQLLASSLIVGNSILNARGIPMCGEYDIRTCIAMFIMDRLNIGGSFAEFHPFDFKEDFIFVGHDGPHHIAIAEGKPVLRSLKKYHGKPGSGASVEFKLKEGPITMLGITQMHSGAIRFIIGEGVSKQGPIPPTGNTNTRGFFEPNTRDFIKQWVMAAPTHHYALGIGHHAETIAKIAETLGIEYVIVR